MGPKNNRLHQIGAHKKLPIQAIKARLMMEKATNSFLICVDFWFDWKYNKEQGFLLKF